MSIPSSGSDDGKESGERDRGTAPPFRRTMRAKMEARGGTEDGSVLRERRKESDRERCWRGETEGALEKAVGAMVKAAPAAD